MRESSTKHQPTTTISNRRPSLWSRTSSYYGPLKTTPTQHHSSDPSNDLTTLNPPSTTHLTPPKARIMSQSPWTCREGTHYQTKDGQGKAKTQVGGMLPNSKKTSSKADHPMSGSAITATNLDTSPGNAGHPNKPETDKHKYRTIWIKTRTYHTCSRRYTLPIC